MAVDTRTISSRAPAHFILLLFSAIAATAVLGERALFYTRV